MNDNLATTEVGRRIAALPPEKRALLERALEKGGSAAHSQAIPRRTDTDSASLSFAQQRLWFLDQWEPGNPAYNIAMAIRMKGVLDVAALERSLTEIARRHEVLRTTFAPTASEPVQVIHPPEPFALSRVELQGAPKEQQEAEARRLATEEALRPFDLSAGPLWRATLLRLEPGQHVLLLTVHHIATDGWSMAVLYRELSALYEAFSKDKPSPLAELPVQYADFAAWQRQSLQGDALAEHVSFWGEQLRGLATLELPTDHPRPPVQTFHGATHTLLLPPGLTEALRALSRQESATLFMTLLAAFQGLLHRYSGQEDIVVGTPIANRNRTEIEGLIGFFVNTLVMRTDASGDPTFHELLSRVRKVALDGYVHQDMPFEKLVEELQPHRDPSRNPLFQVTFALQNAPDQALLLDGLKAQPLPVENDTAKFDLSLAMFEEANGLRGAWEYNTDLFDAATIQRMIGHFKTLLESIAANPDQRLSELSLLTETERNRSLVEWNKHKPRPTDGQCVHERFEAQAASTPEAVAVICGDDRLTYRELNARANCVAHFLHAQGVGPEVPVAMSVERSADMIAGLLGIWKAGGAYVPIDPSYPQERVGFILNDTQAAVLLTDEKLRASIRSGNEISPGNRATPDHLAYVIYTSGSTGTPKGAAITHGAIADHCRTIIPHYRLTGDDRVLQFASLGFDVSLEQILSTLLSGATLVLRGNDVWAGSEFTGFVAHQRLTVVNLPTAYWHEWTRSLLEGSPASLSSHLRLVICGGEAMSQESVRLWQRTSLRDVPLRNAYGPTEATITATTFEVPSPLRDTFPSGWIPIGRPLPNRTAFVLDPHGNPVPIGITGELHVGGDSLARGYLNRPELTAEKFIRNPFPETHGDRLYKTGDLARYRADGTIEFLGRLDHQVKVRGYRIELGEIETVLRDHPAVRQAVVVAPDRGDGERRLVAYVVCAKETPAAPATSELREFLRQKLPDYMMPSAFVFLETLPLTPNGKIDRRALPEPSPSSAVSEAAFVAPRTPLEQSLAQIWRSLLKLDRVSVHDNFFDLGGHSLLATRVISRLRSALNVEVPLRALFEAPTVAGLAAVVEQHLSAPATADTIGRALQEIERLTEEQARRLLDEIPRGTE